MKERNFQKLGLSIAEYELHVAKKYRLGAGQLEDGGFMSERIEQERARIQAALLDPATSPEKYCQFYAAQQALAWAENPDAAAAPFETIAYGKVQPRIMDIQEG